MKASKFTDAQKAFIIKQGKEGTPVAEICRKAGISQATYLIGRRSTLSTTLPSTSNNIVFLTSRLPWKPIRHISLQLYDPYSSTRSETSSLL